MKKKMIPLIAAELLSGCTANDGGTVNTETAVITGETAETSASETTAASSETETSPQTEKAEITLSDTQTSAETSETPTETETEQTTETETETSAVSETVDERYKEAYAKKLYKMAEDNTDTDLISQMAFSVFDIGGDATPELLVSTGSFHAAAVDIYSLDSHGNVVFTGVAGSNGELYYLPEVRQINSMYGGMGGLYNELYEIKDGKLESIVSLYANSTYLPDSDDFSQIEANIDDSPVTSEEYYAAFDEYFGKKHITLGRSYPLFPEFVSAVFEEGTQAEVYDSICTALAQRADQNTVYSKCLFDLDGDGNDELFITNDMVFDGEEPGIGFDCTVYTYKGGLVCMGMMPQYYTTPDDYYRINSLDISYEGTEDTVNSVSANAVLHRISWFVHSSYDEIYTAEYDGTLVTPDTHFQAIKLNDGTYRYFANAKEVTEEQYREMTGDANFGMVDALAFEAVVQG